MKIKKKKKSFYIRKIKSMVKKMPIETFVKK